jgi:chromosome segregation ATPase
MASLSLSIVEIIVLMLGAIVLGITIHFFITSRRNLKNALIDTRAKPDQSLNEWKLKYFNETEVKDREINSLRKQLEELQENSNIFSIEAEETRKQNKKLQAELETLRKMPPAAAQTTHSITTEKVDYFGQLREAQTNLLEHNEKINQLLTHIDALTDTEARQKEMEKNNEYLVEQVNELRKRLSQKEKELNHISQKATLSKEMSSMLDNAYNEFGSLQEKIHKLESQVSASKVSNMEYEDLKEEHYKLKKDFEDQRNKLHSHSNEVHELQSLLTETEDKLRESNFQRQQLQKRVAYLEELNNDLHDVSEANKRLEGQIKRIGELESMLNVVSEERDQLAARRQA